ncbi:MAG: AarF/ABC1/UbiB kinase family protein, partial [Demequinaceae bacterium]|nr:AarF/ABC1/UbiB kinase family protein [Demequinaceae bacterium]
IEPYAAQLLRDETGNLVADFGRQALDNAGVIWRMPARLDEVLNQIEDGSLAVASPKLEREVARLDRTARRLVSAGLFAALLIAGAVVRADDATFGTWLMAASSLPLLHAVLGGRRGR